LLSNTAVRCPIHLSHAALAYFPRDAVMRKVLTDLRHVFPLLKKTYMLLCFFVEQILALIIGTGEQYPKRNIRVTTANRFDDASIGMD
jgi:hypothetical protein